MAARTFAQINCSLLRSKKIKTVDHAARWAYVCAHLTPLASFIGLFSYPTVMWARDAALDDAGFSEARDSLITADLVEWSDEDELVRIVGYHRQRPPQNVSWCVSMIADFEALLTTHDDTGIVLRAAAEFSVAAAAKSATWKPDSPEIPKMREVLGRFLRATHQEHEGEFLAALITETEAASKATMAEFDALLPALAYHRANTLPTPCGDHADIQRRDLDKDQYEEQDEDEDVCEIADFSDPAISSAETSELQRNQQGPTEAAKRSRLAQDP